MEILAIRYLDKIDLPKRLNDDYFKNSKTLERALIGNR